MRAVGGLVWSHTLRASLNLKLTGGVREIWSHIERGFPYADEGSGKYDVGYNQSHWAFSRRFHTSGEIVT